MGQDGISADTIRQFMSLSQDQQKKALGGMSDDVKQSLLKGIQNPPVRPFKLPEMTDSTQAAVGFGSAALDDARALGGAIKDWWHGSFMDKARSLGGVVKPGNMFAGAARTFNETATTLKNPDLDPASKVALTGVALAGGSPEEVQRRRDAGDPGGAAYAAVGRPAATAAAGYLAGKVAEPLVDFGHEMGAKIPGVRNLPGLYEDETVEPFSRSAKSNLAELTIRGMPKEQDVNIMSPGGTIDRMIPYLHQAAKDLGIKESDLPSLFPGRQYEISHPIRSLRESNPSRFRVETGVQNRERLFDRMERIFGDQFDKFIGEYGKERITDPGKILRDITGNITEADETAAPEVKDELNKIARQIAEKNPQTIQQWDELRKAFGNRADRPYRAQAAGATDADYHRADAYRRATDKIRAMEYDQLGVLSDLPSDQIKDLQSKHSDALRMKFANQDASLRAQPGQIEHQNRYIQRVITGKSEQRSPEPRSIMARAFMMGPQGDLNVAARKALRDVDKYRGSGPSVNFESRPGQLRLPARTPEPVEVPTRIGGVDVTPGQPRAQKQLPPISEAQVQGAGAPETTGGVFPQRGAVSVVPHTYYSGYPESPGLPTMSTSMPAERALVRTKRNPFYVTDYVGSGRAGEPAAMPGTSRPSVKIETPQQAKAALKGYRKFYNSARYAALDPADQEKFDQELKHLEAFSRQGAVGPPRNTPTAAPNVSAGGTVKVSTPEDARAMLEKLAQGDFSNLSPAERKQARDTINQLASLANSGSVPPPPRRMRYNPGQTPSSATRRKARNLPGVRKFAAHAAGQAQARGLPPLPTPDEDENEQ